MTSAALLPGWLDPATMIDGFGSWATLGVALIIFAECGLLLGFFLPGDTLLFLAGLLAASARTGGQGLHVPVAVLIAVLAVAAFVGNVVGYAIGRKVGPAVFTDRSRFLKREYVERAEAFFARYGRIAVVLARFVPVVRTLATVMAGVSRMNLRVYTLYSAIGGVLWVTAVTLAGYFLGRIPFVRDHIDLISVAAVLVVVVGLAVPAVSHLRRRRGRSPGSVA
ncbi:VTT domain-containing protein [Nakamurella flavida]|uniref:VTT domain-containing protein n=1 Tax=Nakamurella flavida TaxID=363630 RepID=A0A938YMN4_9ACTN|nr:VTT domain-containing protein [Nakamurella flavida]MBM9477356.1 VTT domain-containing protein [Nakamurella flavida]MDP9777288.1 membrane-associated protein [Nakamurella flavida]